MKSVKFFFYELPTHNPTDITIQLIDFNNFKVYPLYVY